MTVLRSGPPKGYQDNWSKAFGKKKTKASKKSKPASAKTKAAKKSKAKK